MYCRAGRGVSHDGHAYGERREFRHLAQRVGAGERSHAVEHELHALPLSGGELGLHERLGAGTAAAGDHVGQDRGVRVGEVAAVRREFVGHVKPVDTVVVVTGFIDPEWLIEIEVDAIVADDA